MSATAYTNEAIQAPEANEYEACIPLSYFKQLTKIKLSRLDYANAQAAGFDMDQFEVAKPRYVRC